MPFRKAVSHIALPLHLHTILQTIWFLSQEAYNGAELNYGVRDLGEMGSPGMSAVPLIRAEEGKPIGQLLAFVYEEIDEDGNLKFKILMKMEQLILLTGQWLEMDYLN